LATVIPITLNSISKNHLSFTFDYRTSFSGDSKYAKYYGKAPSELGATDITADQFNQFLVNNNNDLDMQFAEIAYGVRTYLYSFFDTTTFDWSAKLYNYHHRINDGEFQCRY
jgi:hypothetical protein